MTDGGLLSESVFVSRFSFEQLLQSCTKTYMQPTFGLLLLYLSVIALCKQPVRLLKGSHKSHVDITKKCNFILSHYIILYAYIYDL